MNVIKTIEEAIKNHTTRFAFELLPPLKGDGTEEVFKAIENVTEYDPAYINITFHRESLKKIVREDGRIKWHLVRRRPGTVGIAAAIQQKYGVDAVPHLICGGLSKYDIEDSLIDMDILGLHNVLALRGDCSQNEKIFMPHPQGHTHAIDLVKQIVAMNNGEFVDGEVENCHHTDFSIGVAGYPEIHAEAENEEDDIKHLKEKVEAGANYIVTQLFLDNSKYFDFEKKCRAVGITVPIIPGIKPLVTKKQLQSLPQTFSIKIPEELIDAINKCGEDNKKIKETGIEWAVMQAKELKEANVPVIHFYTMSKTENIAKIAKQVF